jgi:hypothetical protein
MPTERSAPSIRPDGTSPPRETALVITWLVQQIKTLEARIVALEASRGGP